jgi:hypothetical protein
MRHGARIGDCREELDLELGLRSVFTIGFHIFQNGGFVH